MDLIPPTGTTATAPELAESLTRLAESAARINESLMQVLAEKHEELQYRAFLRCIPSGRVANEELPRFLRLVLGHEPDDDLIERLTQVGRRLRLSHYEIRVLEEEQHLRCALCGVLLERAADPHVDHIQPVAFGGKNTLDNLQLLCRRCNLGKSSLLGWVLGIPYTATYITARLRYCVLSRYGSKCQRSGCSASSKTDPLEVILCIPAQFGGRVAFDNLTVACKRHAEERTAYLRRRALLGLSRVRLGFSMPMKRLPSGACVGFEAIG